MTEHLVCRLSEIAHGHAKRVELNGRAFAIVRCGDEVHAFADRCPHKGAPLSEGKVQEGRGEIICPWHRFRFDLRTGASITNPELLARRQQVRVDGDEVFIEG